MHLIHFDTIESTNDYVLQHLASLLDQTLVVAQRQSAGRGREDKLWVSPPGNLYFSWYRQLPLDYSDLTYLSVNVAVKIVEVLLEHGVVDIGIKWPNDLFLAQKKIGGILIETRKDQTTGEMAIVIGVGLNLVLPNSSAITQPYTALNVHGYSFTPQELLMPLVENINTLFA